MKKSWQPYALHILDAIEKIHPKQIILCKNNLLKCKANVFVFNEKIQNIE